MRHRRSSWLALSLALGVGAKADRARGDDTAAPSDVVVRGQAPALANGFVSRASEEDATREVTDVASLIEPLPGVHVRRLGADDSFSTLSIRGSTSSEVAILFAGVPLTGAADPSLDLASLPLWPGARIKVFRSFTPAAVGSGSLGGTLVLEPPRPTDREGTLVWAGLGSYGEERLRLADVRAIDDDRGRIVAALSASRSADDYSYYDATRSTVAHPVFATRENAQYAGVNGLVTAALPLNLGGALPGTVSITALAQSRLQHLPGPATSPFLFYELATNRELFSFDVAQPTDEAGVVHLLGWTRRDELGSRDDPSITHAADSRVRTDDVIVGAGGAASMQRRLGPRWTVDARLDGSFERFAPGDDVSNFGAEAGATRGSLGGGADLSFQPWNRATLDASARLDANVDAADSLPSGSDYAAPTQGVDVRPTGHLGAEYRVGPIVLATHAGALSRAPSFVERYGGGGVLANPRLVSEAALTADVGARYAVKTSRLQFVFELDGFATHADDLITLIPEGAANLLKAENIAAARIYGVESSADLRGYGFDVRAAYTGLLTSDDDPNACPACRTAPPLPGRPGADFVGDAAYALGPVRIRYGLDFVAGIHPDAAGALLVPSRLLQSAGVRVVVPPVPSLRLACDVNNLFDVRTGLVPGLPGLGEQPVPIGDQFDYPLPGRTFLVTVRWAPGEATPP